LTKNEAELTARIERLVLQRNEALDQVVVLSGLLALAEKQILMEKGDGAHPTED
jgi:hypothetical protein